MKKTSKEFAIVAIGGKQHIVSIGDLIVVEKIRGQYKKGDQILFDKILLVEDGNNTTIGTPYIQNASIKAEIADIGRSKKISVIRYKPKSRYLRRKSHRQPFFKVKILEIL